MNILCESIVGEMFDSNNVLEFPIYGGKVWSCSSPMEKSWYRDRDFCEKIVGKKVRNSGVLF